MDSGCGISYPFGCTYRPNYTCDALPLEPARHMAQIAFQKAQTASIAAASASLTEAYSEWVNAAEQEVIAFTAFEAGDKRFG